jgi:hypothetical protein
VSWEQIQDFLGQINAQIPRLNLALPRSLSDLGVRIAIFPFMRPKKRTFCAFIALAEGI